MAGVSPIDNQPGDHRAVESKPLLSDSSYDRLKQFVTIVLPALGALYFGLAQIWGFPKAEEVVGSLAVIATFGGILLGLSSRAYNTDLAKLKAQGYDGVVNVYPKTDGGHTMSLELNNHPSDLVNQNQVVLKVTPESAQAFGEAPDL